MKRRSGPHVYVLAAPPRPNLHLLVVVKFDRSILYADSVVLTVFVADIDLGILLDWANIYVNPESRA